MDDILVTSDVVPIGSLKEHPANPRRGDITVIAESLRSHGQYRPVVVQRSTGFILAGNHTWKAAKSLGWRQIAVSYVDVSDPDAARILIADNRTVDLASYDEERLVELLKALPDLEGTGFDQYDVEELEGLFTAPTSSEGRSLIPDQPPKMERPNIDINGFALRVASFESWAKRFANGRDRRDVVHDLRERLGMRAPPPAPPAPERPTRGAEVVPIGNLIPYPGNARQGDIGAISESLRHLGQYRPVVVNRRDSTILVGNHTWQAAKLLGWSKIAVNWVDVDEVEAAKIVAVDNRTSDLASYDDESLLGLLSAMPTLDGTGYSNDDLDDLLRQIASNAQHRRPSPSSRVVCRVGDWAWRLSRGEWIEWEECLKPEIEADTIYDWIAHSLDLPNDSWKPEVAL